MAAQRANTPPPSFKPQAEPDAGLTAKQVQELYERLVAEKARLTAGIRRHIEEATSGENQFADEADLASRSADQAYLLRVADKENKLLKQVLKALNKLEFGGYGLCEGTDEPIGIKRLQARPWTRYCIQYKEEMERSKTGRA